jgi:hypothetical protein
LIWQPVSDRSCPGPAEFGQFQTVGLATKFSGNRPFACKLFDSLDPVAAMIQAAPDPDRLRECAAGFNGDARQYTTPSFVRDRKRRSFGSTTASRNSFPCGPARPNANDRIDFLLRRRFDPETTR